MYLKSIVMQGFKSFAHKIDLEFHDGITGIVGPNGSGKSNVADAVRWVLGEQSARQLRGGNMQDVIFAGTEARKPLGFAMVSITFDNEDGRLNYDAGEVTVTRRLYRSGESSYQLNGRSCRLKDINELFFDTGIGKEGYSIIGQGQIDKILSGKPEDRRELFDEAAGIVKFKRRKAASLKKLDAEEQNLMRVQDVLAELSRQRGPLEEQAKKAETFLSLRNEARNVDVELFSIETEKIRAQLQEMEEQRAIAEAHTEELNRAFDQTKQEYGEIESRLSALEERIAAAREENAGGQVKKQQIDGEIGVLTEQIRASERNSELFADRMRSIDEDVARRNAEIEQDAQDRTALREERDALQETRDAEAAELLALQNEIREMTEASEQHRSDTISLLNRRTAIREKLQRYDTMMEHANVRTAEIDAGLLQIKSEEDAQRALIDEITKAAAALEEKISKKQTALEKTDRQIDDLKKTLDEQNKQLEIGQSAYHRESSRLESLRNIAERYEGYGNSVKRVMEQRSDNPGIHGVVAELIKTEQKYETAIETALGGGLQNIVTDNENTAKYLIEFLKRGHYGRATFLPLTSVKERRPFDREDVLAESGVIGLASDLVSCDKLYRAVIANLIGQTVVVEHVDDAIRIGRKYHHSIRMVTLEGELFNKGGAITGGAFRNSSNLLGRQREIDELEKSVRMLKRELTSVQEQIEQTRAKRQEQRALEQTLSDELQKLLLEQNTARLNLEAAQGKDQELAGQIEQYATERREIEAQIHDIEMSQKEVGAELSASEDEESRLESEVSKASDALAALHEREEAMRAKHEEAALSYANAEQREQFLAEKIRAAKDEIARLGEEQAGLAERIAGEDAQVKEKEAKIAALERDGEELLGRLEAGEKQIEAYLAEKEEMNRSHKDFFEKRDAILAERTEMEKESFRLETRIARANEQNDRLAAALWENYEISPDQAQQLRRGDMGSPTALRKRQSELKAEIRELGEVNVNAIESFRELKERHDFMTEQHADIIKAADALRDIIKKLDASMRRQFKETFEKMQVEYNKVFKDLFGGGKGTLELVEGEDILDAGILINAQPPGKKLQNMMQLSGGEKALTAIALLFAIQNLKPSPFCLLDEIEAALDDSNVTRFSEYLNQLTKNTQFIIITHRRGTMSAADRLYGITMQEKGVSALVSVNLIESKLDE